MSLAKTVGEGEVFTISIKSTLDQREIEVCESKNRVYAYITVIFSE